MAEDGTGSNADAIGARVFIERSQAIAKSLRLNDLIRISPVRVIDQEQNQLGIIPTAEALSLAREAGLDLVEVSPTEKPPVCRIMDYGKFVFEQTKKKHASKKKQKQIQVKEIKIRPGTEEGDYQIKLRNLIKFLSQGDKVKIKGRYKKEKKYLLYKIKNVIKARTVEKI